MRFIRETDWPLYQDIEARLNRARTWKTRIERCMPESKFFPPASDANLRAVERALGCELPDDLRALLTESNGVKAPYSTLIYSTDRIIAVNREFRDAEHLADRMPFDHMLFFGEVSDGDEFAFPLFRNGVSGNAVFIWSHETDCREE